MFRYLLTALFAASMASAHAAEPSLTKTDLFESGKDGYVLYRIPAIVATPKGSLLVVCEARKSTSDWAKIDLLIRRSTDGGKTWTEPKPIVSPKGPFARNPVAKVKAGAENDITLNNPVLIADTQAGVVHFLYCVEYMRCFYCRSNDDGATFSDPVEITGAFDKFRPEYGWKVLATGPGHGLQTKSGRLIVPVWLSTGTGGNAHRPSVMSTVYSDDQGKTWNRGAVVANETDPLINPNETTIAELSDGKVMLNIRHESKNHRRAVSVSADGATQWTRPAFDEALVEPICMGSLLNVPGVGLIFTNPDNLDPAKGEAKPGASRARKNLTLRLSPDDGKTWPVVKRLEPGPSAYSDLAVGPDGWIYCLYERGKPNDKNATASQLLTLARFNREWLKP